MKRTRKSANAALTLVIGVMTSTAQADTPYATQLVAQNGAYGSNSLYNDPNAVLGSPTRIAVNNDPTVGTSPFHVKIVEPASNRDLNNNKVITTLSRSGTTYGSITVTFDHDIVDDPANPYGIDLNVFGNSSYVSNGFVSDTSDMRTSALTGGIIAEPVVVSVSPDNINWYTYSTGPYGDTAFPTQGNTWSPTQHDATGNGWTTQATDFTKPVNPTLDAMLGAADTTLPVYDAMKTYVNSGGGTGIDLAASGFHSIRYVRVNSTPQFRDGEIDAFADVRPMQVGEALSITPANVIDNTLLKFQNASSPSRTAVVADFSAVSDLAKLSTGSFTNGAAIASLPADQDVLAAYSLSVTGLINESAAITFAADLSLLPGLDYLGNGSNLKLLSWNGTTWQNLPFSFDTNSGFVNYDNWSGATNNFAVVALPYYWDVNGATPGAGGSSPSGNWNGMAANFTLDPAGSLANTSASAAGGNVIFTAGGEGSGSYTVNVSGTQSATAVVIPRGNINFTGGAIATASFDLSAGASATVSSNLTGGTSSSFTKKGTGTLTITSANTYTGGTTVAAGTLVVANADALGTGGLTIADAATTRAAANLPKAVSIATLTTAGTGKLDLTNNAMVVKNSTLAAVDALVTLGYNNGDWLGGGIASSTAATDPSGLTAIGFVSNAELGANSFEGVTGLDGDDILVKYTYYGDADLNGVVDPDDFNAFLAGFQDASLPRTWVYGDFDYNNVIDPDDFNLFLAAFQNNGAPLSEVVSAIERSSLSEADRQLLLGAISAVPEPTSLAVLGVAVSAFVARRRRGGNA